MFYRGLPSDKKTKPPHMSPGPSIPNFVPKGGTNPQINNHQKPLDHNPPFLKQGGTPKIIPRGYLPPLPPAPVINPCIKEKAFQGVLGY